MNIAITTIQDWAFGKNEPREYWHTYNSNIMSSCRIYDKRVDEYIESKGMSTMSRVFMLKDDEELHKAAHEYAKDATVSYFHFVCDMYKERVKVDNYLIKSHLDEYDGVMIEGTYSVLPLRFKDSIGREY